MRRNTQQKALIIEVFNSIQGHPSAIEVYNIVNKISPNISLKTIYRNLNIMAEEGHITRLHISNECDRYDKNPKRHLHIICFCCGKIDDVFDIDLEDRIIESVKENEKFKIVEGSIILKGLCEDCNNKINIKEI